MIFFSKWKAVWTLDVDPLCRVPCSSSLTTAAGCTLNPDYPSETPENNISTTQREKVPLSGMFFFLKKRRKLKLLSGFLQTENSQRSRGIPEEPQPGTCLTWGGGHLDPTTRTTAELRSAGSHDGSTRSWMCGGFEERKCSSVLRPPEWGHSGGGAQVSEAELRFQRFWMRFSVCKAPNWPQQETVGCEQENTAAAPVEEKNKHRVCQIKLWAGSCYTNTT